MTSTQDPADPLPQEAARNDPGFAQEIIAVMSKAIQKHLGIGFSDGHGSTPALARTQTTAGDVLSLAYEQFVETSTRMRDPRAIAYRIAQRQAFKAIERENRHRLRLVSGDEPVGGGDDGTVRTRFDTEVGAVEDDTEEVHNAIVQTELVELSRGLMSERDHRILWLRIAGYETTEVASDVGLSHGRVREIFRARLRDLLQHPECRRHFPGVDLTEGDDNG